LTLYRLTDIMLLVVSDVNIDELLKEKRLTRYRLAKDSGVPYATLSDICSGKARIEKCSVDTLYRLAKRLEVSMEFLIEDRMKALAAPERRSSFEVFKSNVCHLVRDMGDVAFIVDTLESNRIRVYFERQWFPESLYLLAMLDFLSRESGLPLCSEYDDIRAAKLAEPLYPAGVLLLCAALENGKPKEESLASAIPEFLRFNIIESEIRNVA